jgi:hypothetical protein
MRAAPVAGRRCAKNKGAKREVIQTPASDQSPLKRLNEASKSTGSPRSQRVNWWTISPAAMLAA